MTDLCRKIDTRERKRIEGGSGRGKSVICQTTPLSESSSAAGNKNIRETRLEVKLPKLDFPMFNGSHLRNGEVNAVGSLTFIILLKIEELVPRTLP